MAAAKCLCGSPLDEDGRCERQEIAMARRRTLAPYSSPPDELLRQYEAVFCADRVYDGTVIPPGKPMLLETMNYWIAEEAEFLPSKPDIIAAIREIARRGTR